MHNWLKCLKDGRLLVAGFCGSMTTEKIVFVSIAIILIRTFLEEKGRGNAHFRHEKRGQDAARVDASSTPTLRLCWALDVQPGPTSLNRL